MDQIREVIGYLQEFVQQHLPTDSLQHIGWQSGILLLGGILLCVFGAKMARWGVTAVGVAAGGALGFAAAKGVGFQPIGPALLFAAAGGVIAFMTFRVWVAILTSLVLTGLIVGAFGMRRVGPMVGEYNTQKVQLVAANGENSEQFSLGNGTAEEPCQRFRQSVDELWGYVKDQDPKLPGQGRALGLTALVFGLLIGLSAVRWMAILSTSALGTIALFSGGLGVLASMSRAGLALEHPGALSIAMGVVFFLSFFMQMRLTRPVTAKSDADGDD